MIGLANVLTRMISSDHFMALDFHSCQHVCVPVRVRQRSMWAQQDNEVGMYASGGMQQNIEGNVFEGNGGPGVVLFGTRATTMDSNCKSETILFKIENRDFRLGKGVVLLTKALPF